MKTLFVYTNINGFHEDVYSFGLASIVSVTRTNNHDAKVVIVRRKNDYLKVLDEISIFKPRIVGFSSVSSQFHFIKEMAGIIKSRFPDIITVCGGVHPTISPDCLSETDFLDGIFVGESENSFVEFIKKIERGEDYQGTDNFAHRQGGRLIINNLKPLVSDLDSLPYPDREVYPFEDTLKAIGYAPFIFSRGCPYLCSYCSNHALAKRYNLPRNFPRYRSPESSVREIEDVIGHFRVEIVCVGDDIFGLDRRWAEEFCKKYKERIKLKFLCLLRADTVDEGFIRLLKDAGCYRISIGIESGNEHVRNEIMNRRMSNEQIARVFGLAHKYGLQTNAINIIGCPGESEEMLWDTIRLNRRLEPTSSGVNIFYPYKGTSLGDYCFEKGLVDETLYYSFSNERRESVLKFPDRYKKKLSYYVRNWDSLIYPFALKRRLANFIKKTSIWKYLRVIKKRIFPNTYRRITERLEAGDHDT